MGGRDDRQRRERGRSPKEPSSLVALWPHFDGESNLADSQISDEAVSPFDFRPNVLAVNRDLLLPSSQATDVPGRGGAIASERGWNFHEKGADRGIPEYSIYGRRGQQKENSGD